MAAPSPRKLLEIYNLRTTNAMMMKFGTVVYLDETFHLTKYLGVVLRLSEGVAQKPLKKTPKIGFFGPVTRILNNKSKPVTYVILCRALDHL